MKINVTSVLPKQATHCGFTDLDKKKAYICSDGSIIIFWDTDEWRGFPSEREGTFFYSQDNMSKTIYWSEWHGRIEITF